MYSSLETYFKLEGAIGLAREVGFESERQHRRKVLWKEAGFGWNGFKASLAWLLNWLLELTVGHGHYPILSLAWSALVVLIGARIFRWESMQIDPDRQEVNVPRKEPKTRLEKNPRVVRFQRPHLPCPLDANNHWGPKPESRLAWHCLAGHRTLGAILVPIGLAAFSGIIK